MVEQGSMTKEAGAGLRDLAEQLKSSAPGAAARALYELYENGLPSTAQQAFMLRDSKAMEKLAVMLETSTEVTMRNQAANVIARMCRHDHLSQDAFINLGVVRKLIKNADTTQSGGADAPTAVRALVCLVGGSGVGTPANTTALEELFVSGTILRMRGELASRRKPDDVICAIGELLAALAANPASHPRLCDALVVPLLPPWIESTLELVGPAAAAAFAEAAYQLSMTDAVVTPYMRNESYFEALQRVVSHSGALPNLRRTALLTMCNVFGGDTDHVRAEEVLRSHSVPAMLAALLAAALGPADVGAASRAAATAAASPRQGGGSNSGILGQRISAQRVSDSGDAGGVRAAAGMRISNGSGGAGGMAERTSDPHQAASGWRHGQTTFGEAQSAAASNGIMGGIMGGGGGGIMIGGRFRGGGGGDGSRRSTGNGYILSSLTAPGLSNGGGAGGGAQANGHVGGAGARVSYAHGTYDNGGNGSNGFDLAPPPLEAVLHSLTCVSANPMLARKLARPGSPSYVLPYILDAVVASQQHAAAGDISRAAWVVRAAAAAQTLLRLASCAELVPALRHAGVGGVLRLLAHEADEPRVSEAARSALLYMGDGGHAGLAGRAAAAAFRALYRNGANSAGSEPELGSRFQVFISHHRADAHQFAFYTLYPILVNQGVPTFVDPQHRTMSSDWAHMVACCRNLLVVLSEVLLESPEHLREAEAAVQAGVNLVAVIPEGCRWRDAQGDKTLDAPPQPVLDSLPVRLRGILTDKALVYSSAQHSDFTQQLMARLQLLPAEAAAADAVTGSPARGELPGRRSGNGVDTRARGRGWREGLRDSHLGDDAGHRVSFTSDGEMTQQQQQQDDEKEGELGAELPPTLPWPWCRFFDSTGMGEGEEAPVRYPRVPLGLIGLINGSTGGETLSGGGPRLCSSSLVAAQNATAQHMAAPLAAGAPAAGAPASYTSRRHTARQRSSLNRHAALQLQQQQQQLVVQQQWVHEYQQQQQQQQQQQEQQQTIVGPSGEEEAENGGEPSADPSSTMLSQLLALQLEMVRYELRQAVQASLEMVTYKIDRLRSDVTEQVVQLRFDLAGKIEALQEALSKATGASGKLSLDSATPTASEHGGVGAATDAASSSPRRQPPTPPTPQQQLAQAISASVATSLQDVVNKAVAQLQASVALAVPMPARPSTFVGGLAPLPGPLPKGHPGAAAMLAAAAAQQQQVVQQQHAQQQQAPPPPPQQQQQAAQQVHYNPHPPVQPSAHVRGSVVVPPAAPHQPQGVELLSPVARAGAAAWSGDGTGNGSGGGGGVGGTAGAGGPGGGAKPRVSHPAGGNGVAAPGKGSAHPAAPAPPAAGTTRPGPLAMFDAAAAEDDAGAAGDGRVMSPNTLLASVTSPATAQAAILMVGRARQHVPPTQAAAAAAAGVAAGGGVSPRDRGGSATGPGPGAAALAAAGGGGGGAHGRGFTVNILPPLAGLGGGGPLSPTSSVKLVDRTDAQPVRRAQQQQQILLQQQLQQTAYH